METEQVTFFQALNTVSPRKDHVSFADWLTAAQAAFMERVPPGYINSYVALAAFYPPEGPDGIVWHWLDGEPPHTYAKARLAVCGLT